MTRLEMAEALLRRHWHATTCKCDDCRDKRAFLDASPSPPQREATPCKPGIEAHFGPCSRGTPKAECRRVADEGTRNAIMVCACECHPDHAEPFPPAAPPPPPCTVCAWFCGREEADHDELEGEWHFGAGTGFCFCTPACRDAGRPLNPVSRP